MITYSKDTKVCNDARGDEYITNNTLNSFIKRHNGFFPSSLLISQTTNQLKYTKEIIFQLQKKVISKAVFEHHAEVNLNVKDH